MGKDIFLVYGAAVFGAGLVTEPDVFQLIYEKGLLNTAATIFVAILLQQFWKNKERLTETWVNFCGRLAELLVNHIRERQEAFITKISDNISEIYSHLSHLIKYQPIRALVLCIEKQSLLVYVKHEAHFSLTSMKPFWQGIKMGKQEATLLDELHETGEFYIDDVETMADGSYKQLLESCDVQSCFHLVIHISKKNIWVLLVAFNRRDGLDSASSTAIRLAGANIKKLMFQ